MNVLQYLLFALFSFVSDVDQFSVSPQILRIGLFHAIFSYRGSVALIFSLVFFFLFFFFLLLF